MRALPMRPPAWLLACKLALAALLVTGALFPHVGGFEGKGIAFRLPIFLAPALIVPIRWLRRRGAYAVALDAGLTLPFLFDTAVMRAGVGGLSLTYADTLADLVLSTSGGAIGAWAALRWIDTRQGPGRTAAARSFTG